LQKPVPQVFAYATSPDRLPIVPGSMDRNWMDKSQERFAYRCLPLRIANQLGWFLLNDADFIAVWNGKDSPQGVSITPVNGGHPKHITSHFGYGIITWNVPYLFRTPPGYNLYVRGPTNMFKDGIHPLDGVIETDWAVATFTMNWKFTCVGVPVSFKKDEPIAMFFPIQRGFVEGFQLAVDSINSVPETKMEYQDWSKSRDAFLHAYNASADKRMIWEKDYFLGRTLSGKRFENHQVAVQLAPIVDSLSHNCPDNSVAILENPNSKYRDRRIAEAGFRALWQRVKARFSVRRHG
jgi:Family of unknown function (DUF6065)